MRSLSEFIFNKKINIKEDKLWPGWDKAMSHIYKTGPDRYISWSIDTPDNILSNIYPKSLEYSIEIYYSEKDKTIDIILKSKRGRLRDWKIVIILPENIKYQSSLLSQVGNAFHNHPDIFTIMWGNPAENIIVEQIQWPEFEKNYINK